VPRTIRKCFPLAAGTGGSTTLHHPKSKAKIKIKNAGEIPASLRGTFYRVGADPVWPPFVERDFYFNAHGMVAKLSVARGLLSASGIRSNVCRAGKLSVS
jgi:carotenoid cleavage dioxygenase-like enzyme